MSPAQNESPDHWRGAFIRPLPGWQPGQGLARMTAAAAPVCTGRTGCGSSWSRRLRRSSPRCWRRRARTGIRARSRRLSRRASRGTCPAPRPDGLTSPSPGPAGTGRRARDGAGPLLPPGGESSWCHQFDARGRRSATPRMAWAKRAWCSSFRSRLYATHAMSISRRLSDGPAPVVIFYNGLDVAQGAPVRHHRRPVHPPRRIASLIIDTPGTGEPLRLRGVPSRPDYEVPTAGDRRLPADPAGRRSRPDRAARRQPGRLLRATRRRVRAQDQGVRRVVRMYGTTASAGSTGGSAVRTTTFTPFWQLPWVMGTDTMEAPSNGSGSGLSPT